MYQSASVFKQGGYLYKPTSGIQWTPKHLWMSDRPKKSLIKNRPVNIWQWCTGNQLVLLVELSIDDESYSLI